jgi:hypothetical protein
VEKGSIFEKICYRHSIEIKEIETKCLVLGRKLLISKNLNGLINKFLKQKKCMAWENTQKS